MNVKLTQFSKKPATRSMVCSRCGYRMFQTKRFNWLCGPGCDGAQEWHHLLMDEQQVRSTSCVQDGGFVNTPKS